MSSKYETEAIIRFYQVHEMWALILAYQKEWNFYLMRESHSQLCKFVIMLQFESLNYREFKSSNTA